MSRPGQRSKAKEITCGAGLALLLGAAGCNGIAGIREGLLYETRTIEAGGRHTCALVKDGLVKCWGDNESGQLGVVTLEGDGDSPAEMEDERLGIDLGTGTGRTATAIATGDAHSCALLAGGQVKCWGDNESGQLGIGDTLDRGDRPGQMGDNLPSVDLGAGRTATAIAAGAFHTCALLSDGGLKCWGENASGQLGLGDLTPRGRSPDEMGDALPAVNLGDGKTATAIAAGDVHTCALLNDGSLKCWGNNTRGQLGVGDVQNRGDNPDEMGDSLPPVDVGAGRTATSIAAGTFHTCALLDDGSLKCWGDNSRGQLGLGDTKDRGDGLTEAEDTLIAVNLGAGKKAIAVAAGDKHTCALLDDERLKCWGDNSFGQLGLGDSQSRGDDLAEMGDKLPAVELSADRTALAVAAGATHTCALLDDRSVKCWGRNLVGQLGLGDVKNRGDEPGEMGDDLPTVKLFSPAR